MTSIGDTLRRERLRRNLELSTIAGELRISGRFLQAIEADDFAKLPGGVFTKSFVRQYAAFLGLDSEELASAVQRVVEPAPEAQLSGKPKPDVPGMQVDSGANWRSIGGGHAPWPSWIRAGALLIVLMLVCSAVYWWWQRPRHQVAAVEVPPAPHAAPVPQSTPAVTQPTATDAGVSPAAQPPAEQPAVKPPVVAESAPPPVAATAIPQSASNPKASVRVAITADEAVWIRADVNGKYQFSGVLPAHETRNIDTDGEVRVRLGNAGGVTMTLNGKPVGAVGPKGQVRTVQFTSGGFQIVSPPKPLDPLDRL